MYGMFVGFFVPGRGRTGSGFCSPCWVSGAWWVVKLISPMGWTVRAALLSTYLAEEGARQFDRSLT